MKINQPELGKRILALRKEKGLTQEELVELCHVSVRTIQRIESGEVTPRNYTIKIILAALGYDEQQSDNDDNNTTTNRFINKIFALDFNLKNQPAELTKQFSLAATMGIIYFIVGFFEGAADYFLYEDQELIYPRILYVLIKIISMVSFTFFMRGFIITGNIYKHLLLKISSIIIIVLNVLYVGYHIAMVYYQIAEQEFIMGAMGLTFGTIGLIYGFSLVQLRRKIGRTAKYAGIFEIIAGACFITLIFSFVGFIVLIPAEMLEIIILFMMIEYVKSKQESIL